MMEQPADIEYEDQLLKVVDKDTKEDEVIERNDGSIHDPGELNGSDNSLSSEESVSIDSGVSAVVDSSVFVDIDSIIVNDTGIEDIGSKILCENCSNSSEHIDIEPVDFVITWINGTDPVYHEILSHYAPDLNPQRFREYGSLFFCILSLLKNAPWLRYIHIITSHGQVPSFAHLFPQIRIIPDSLILPPDALPTFNSHVLEAYIYRIPELSEKFIYICDDFFLGRPTTQHDFFNGSRPIIYLATNPVFNLTKQYKEIFFQAPVNSINKLIEYDMIDSERLYRNIPHVGRPMIKSELTRLAEIFVGELHNTSLHHLRNSEDYHIFTLYYWADISDPIMILLDSDTNDEGLYHQFIKMNGGVRTRVRKAFAKGWLWIGLNDDFKDKFFKFGKKSFQLIMSKIFCDTEPQFKGYCRFVYPYGMSKYIV